MKHREQIAEEEYNESLKDAERIYKKATENPRAKDVMNELIERQIEEVGEFLRLTNSYPVIQTFKDARRSCHGLWQACERLLQIVQNQQAQIDALLRARRDECGHSFVQNGACVECGAPWSEVKQ